MAYTIDQSQLNQAPTSNPGDAPGGMPRGLDIANSVFGWLGQINNSVFSWLNPNQVSVGIGNQPNNTTNNQAPAPAAADNTTLWIVVGFVAVVLVGGIVYVVAKKK